MQNLQIQKSHKPGSQSDADIYWMRENLQSTVRLCKNCRMPKECKFCKYKNATNLDHKVVQTYNNMRKKLQKNIKTLYKLCRMQKECKTCQYKKATDLDHKVVQKYTKMRRNVQKEERLCKHCRMPKECKICKYKKPKTWISKWCRHTPR